MRKLLKFLPFLPILLLVPYFAFVHPAIIYYNVPHSSINTPNGKLALFYLALSFILWGFVFGFILWIIYKSGIGAKINMRSMESSAKKVPAIIREVKTMKKLSAEIESKEVIFEMNNFSHEKIRHKMVINDTRPQEKRYEAGKTIYLRIDPEFKRYPFIFLEGSQAKINYLPYLAWMFCLAVVILYYYYAYMTENGGYGWRFLELFHPILVSPAVLIFFGGIFYVISRLFILGDFVPRKKLKLKFWGEQAMAKVTEVKQTGTYINEQPQVKYTLEFTDKKGKIHQATKKEIVSLMDIGHVAMIKQREIIYMPDNPEIFSFFDEINN